MTISEKEELLEAAGGRLWNFDWEDLYDRGDLSRGDGYRGQVSGFQIERNQKRLEITSKVAGTQSRPYTAKITFLEIGRSFDLSAHCSCPVGSFCKHTAATLFHIEDLTEEFGEPYDDFADQFDDDDESEVVDIKRSVERLFHVAEHHLESTHRPGAGADTLKWLNRIADAADVKGPVADLPEHYLDTEWKQMGVFYRVINLQATAPAGSKLPDRGGVLGLDICKVKRLKSGDFNAPMRIGTEGLVERNYPDFVPNVEQERIQSFLGLAVGEDFTKAGYVFTPRDERWFGPLVQALEDRVIAFLPGDAPLQKGKPKAVEAHWVMDSGGDSLSAVRFTETQKPVLVFDTQPPVYVDRASATWGEALIDLPGGISVKDWLDAPAISPSYFEKVNQTLSAASVVSDTGTGVLPSLPEVEKQIGTMAKPTGRLVLRCIELRSRPAFSSIFNLVGVSGASEGELGVAELSFRYGERLLEKPISKHGKNVVFVDGQEVVPLTRDFEVEKSLVADLYEIGLETASQHEDSGLIIGDSSDYLAVGYDCPVPDLVYWQEFATLQIPKLEKAGWEVEIDDSFFFQTASPSKWYGEFSPSTHDIDWMEYDYGFEHDGRRLSLIPVIAGVLQQTRGEIDYQAMIDTPEHEIQPVYVAEENLLVSVPTHLLGKLIQALSELFDYEDGGVLHLHPLRAAQIAEAIPCDDSETARHLRKFGKKLANFEGIETVKLPKTLKAELRPYQQEGLNWLQFLREHRLNGILADDMGLGKTVQTLSSIQVEKSGRRHKNPSLIIAPTSVVTNWVAESEKFTPRLKTLLLHGNDRKERFDQIDQADLVITSYALINRDIDIHLEHEYHYVILDEAQMIKNPKSKMAQNACQLRSRHRLCLTGTPMENHLGELWSIVHFLMPGFLGAHDQFRRSWQNPIEVHDNSNRREQLVRKMAPLILRRTKENVLKELPPRTDIVQDVVLDTAQSQLYESVRAAMDKRVREALADKGLNRSHIIVLDALLKLRQICCHPQLLKIDSAKKVKTSAKLEVFKDLIDQQVEAGRRILVFSQFTSMIKLIERALDEMQIGHVKLTGATRKRQEVIDRFQNGDVPVFLISLKAGGSGLNLTAADCVIHYDPWWNPAVEEQATARAHRMGQQNPVFVYRLVTKGSIEERILELQQKKADLAQGVLAGGEAKDNEGGMKSLSQNDLEMLLAPIDTI